MAYADLLEDETALSRFLIVLRPRVRVTSFSLHSGSVYKASFDKSQVIYKVEADGVELTKASSTSLNANEWYLDVANEMLYVRLTSGADPDTVHLVATYEIYVSNQDAHWYRIPTDDTSDQVYYEPFIIKSPVLKQTMSDAVGGYIPTQTSSLVLSNAEHDFEKHLYDVSWSQAQILVYHKLGVLSVDNIKLVLNGLMGNVSVDDNKLTISVTDRVDLFKKEFRNQTGSNFLNTTDTPNLDPNLLGRPIRQVYGRVEGVVPYNIDYVSDSPTTSDNRDYVVCAGQTGLSELVRTIQVGSTTTRTYLDSVAGLYVGDAVWLDKVSDEYRVINLVNRTSNYIEHAALSAAGAAGEYVKRGFVSRVTIVQGGNEYVAYYNRDYTVNTGIAGNCSGFSFRTTMEANTSLPSTLSPLDQVFCTVYGRVNDITLGGNPFGSNHSVTGNIATSAQIMLDLFKRCLGVSESDINAASFTTALSARTEPLGVAIPESSLDQFTTYRDLFAKLLTTGLYQLTLDADNKWAIVVIGPITSSDISTDSDEILDRSFNYSFDYADVVSDIIVEYDKREAAGRDTSLIKSTSAVSSEAKYLHKIDKQKTLQSYHFQTLDAEQLAERMAYIFGDRTGRLQSS